MKRIEIDSQVKEAAIDVPGDPSQRPEQLSLKRQRRNWLAENRDAIEAYNGRIEKYGVFSDGLRRF